jgi:hypothetical protein
VIYRILVTSFALTLMAAGCDVGVPSQKEVAELEKATPPAAETAAPLPPQMNTLPPSHPPVEGAAAPAGMPAMTGHPPVGPSSTTPAVEAGSIPVAEGGVTIEGLFAKKADLAGQPVTIRGKVVKATVGVMGTNWYHLEDGTGAAGSNDLTVTSDAMAKVGDVVVIAGTVATDKDFGMGYKYDVIVEKATLTAE